MLLQKIKQKDSIKLNVIGIFLGFGTYAEEKQSKKDHRLKGS